MKKFKKILLSSICVSSVALAAIPVAIGLTKTSDVTFSNNNQQISSKDEVNNTQKPSTNGNEAINFSMNIQNIDNVENIGENKLTSKFKFTFDLFENDLISYRIIEVQPIKEVLREKQNFIPIQKIARKTSNVYELIKSFDKIVSYKNTEYKIYVEVKRGEIFAKSEASFSVKSIPVGETKTISTKILNDVNEISKFFRLDGGINRENVERINALALSFKLLYLNGSFIENSNINVLIAEFANIDLHVVYEDSTTLIIDVFYSTRENYKLENGLMFNQKTFVLKK